MATHLTVAVFWDSDWTSYFVTVLELWLAHKAFCSSAAARSMFDVVMRYCVDDAFLISGFYRMKNSHAFAERRALNG